MISQFLGQLASDFIPQQNTAEYDIQLRSLTIAQGSRDLRYVPCLLTRPVVESRTPNVIPVSRADKELCPRGNSSDKKFHILTSACVTATSPLLILARFSDYSLSAVSHRVPTAFLTPCTHRRTQAISTTLAKYSKIHQVSKRIEMPQRPKRKHE